MTEARGPSTPHGGSARKSLLWASVGLSFVLALAVTYIAVGQWRHEPRPEKAEASDALQIAPTAPSTNRRPLAVAPPRGADEQPSADDPCAALMRRVSEPPSRSEASQLLAELASTPASCMGRVPVEWQAALARAACAQGERPRDAQCPGAWALPALEAIVRAGSGGVEAECLVRLASTVGADQAPRLAAVLAQGYAAFPSWSEILPTVRAFSEYDWWRAFWLGLAAEDASGLKEKVYAAIGTLSGRHGLVDFIKHSVEWEDVATTEGILGLAAASTVLVKYMPEETPGLSVLVPASPRMRMVMLHSVPPQLSWPFVKNPWFSRDEIHSEVSRLFFQASDDIKERSWKEDWVSNEWTFSGFDLAMASFRDSFPDNVALIEQFDHWQRLRIVAALRALAQLVTIPLPDSGRLSGELREALESVFARATPLALSDLVLNQQAAFVDPTVRSLVADMLKDRLDHLSARARATLGH